MSSALATFLLAAQDFLEPLLEELRSPEGVEHLFYRNGWSTLIDDNVFAQLDTAIGLRADLDSFMAAMGPVRERLLDEGDDPSSGELLALAESFSAVIKRIADFDISAIEHLPAPVGDGAAWNAILDAVFDTLLDRYLKIHHPIAYLLLLAGGVLTHAKVPPAAPGRVGTALARFDWEQMGRLLSDPVGAMRQAYRWDDPAAPFDAQRLFEVIDGAFTALRLATASLSPTIQLDPAALGSTAERIAREQRGLSATLLTGFLRETHSEFELGFDLWPIVKTPGAEDVTGVMLVLRALGSVGTTIPLGETFSAKWTLTGDPGAMLAVIVEPDGASLANGSAVFDTSISVERTGDQPWQLLGRADGARMELRRPMLRAELSGSSDDAAVRVSYGSADPSGGLDVIVPIGQSDSLVRTLASKDEIKFSFRPNVGWSSKSGFVVDGSLLPRITIPANISLGPITLEQLFLALQEKSSASGVTGMAAAIGVNFKGHFGPLEVVVQNIGFVAGITPYTREQLRALPADEGDLWLGNLGLDFDFSGPTGLGIRIDAGAVSGGGFIGHDSAQHIYAGAFEFTFARVSLKALVELHTDVEGAPFALLAIVYARFPGGLELGLRFTLNAVGGMIGVNRGFDYQALVEALSSGAMDNILFPEDPVADAPRIFASLAAICPVRPGAYTLALMAELGWGSDYICALRLGLILPLDDMRRIYLIGQLRIQCFRHMPETVRLQLICDAAGVIGFDPFSLRFDGRLRDSRFGPIGIEGQIVLLLDTGENPRFLVAAGGFHPNFKAIPSGLPSKIDRLAVTYEVGGFKAWMKGYFALAAGTVQFGAEVGCRYKAGSIAFTGNLGVDALIHISPFTFEAETRFNVAVEYRGHELFGVHVTATLWGPDHWRIKGHGSFSILFWDIGIDFDESWGDDVEAAAEPVVLLAKAAEDLANDTYWQFETPSAAGMVNLASGAGAGAAAHPLASLTYRQRRFPFGMELDRIGSAVVSGPRSVPVPVFHSTLGGTAIPGDAALDPFAVGEYVELDDEARLTRPSFEPLPAGVRAGISGYRLPDHAAVEAAIDYEQVYLPRRTKFTGLADLHADLVADLLGHEAAGRSSVRAAGKLARQRSEKVTVRQPKWAAADPVTLAPITDPGAVAWTADAPSALSARRKDNALTLEAFEMAA